MQNSDNSDHVQNAESSMNSKNSENSQKSKNSQNALLLYIILFCFVGLLVFLVPQRNQQNTALQVPTGRKFENYFFNRLPAFLFLNRF